MPFLLPTDSIKAHHHHNRFTALFPGPPGQAGARRELLDFMVQEEINRGRHCHCIPANQCPPPPSPIFLRAGCPSCCPNNHVKALKATSVSKQWIKCKRNTNVSALLTRCDCNGPASCFVPLRRVVAATMLLCRGRRDQVYDISHNSTEFVCLLKPLT